MYISEMHCKYEKYSKYVKYDRYVQYDKYDQYDRNVQYDKYVPPPFDMTDMSNMQKNMTNLNPPPNYM